MLSNAKVLALCCGQIQLSANAKESKTVMIDHSHPALSPTNPVIANIRLITQDGYHGRYQLSLRMRNNTWNFFGTAKIRSRTSLDFPFDIDFLTSTNPNPKQIKGEIVPTTINNKNARQLTRN